MTEITYVAFTKKMDLSIRQDEFKAMVGSFAWLKMRQNRLGIQVDWDQTKAICEPAVQYRQAHYSLREVVEDWCKEHCTNLYYVQHDPIVAHFVSHRDAVACKLHFHDVTLTSRI